MSIMRPHPPQELLIINSPRRYIEGRILLHGVMGNSQPVFNRLEVPSFGLAWLNLDDSTGDSLVLIPGGGGSTKSGVRNQIQIGRYLLGDSRGGFEFLKSYETDVDDKSILCSGVAVGTCMGTKVVCIFLDDHCAILTVNVLGNEMILKRVVDFQADFSEDGSVNCACILPSGHIVTGGDDGICRLWAVGFITDKDSDSKDKIWRVRLLNKMEGHSSAIMDISHHPNDALVSTLDDSIQDNNNLTMQYYYVDYAEIYNTDQPRIVQISTMLEKHP